MDDGPSRHRGAPQCPALQEGFRRDLATTPMTYLREIRLRRAREALKVADRDSTTVGAVAVGLGSCT